MKENCYKRVYILCRWTDNKRKNVYIKGLGKIGYKVSRFFGKEYLYKKIKLEV